MQKEIKNNDRFYKIIKGILAACIPFFIFLCVSWFLQRRNIIPSDFSSVTKKEKTPVNVSAEKQQNITKSLEGAILANDLELVKNFINQGADVNAKDNLGNPYLSLACQYGSIEIVKELIEKGADVNAKDQNGYTALIRAINRKNLNIAKFLIENGADVNTKINDGSTPLIFANFNRDIESTKLLIEAGANVNEKVQGKYSPLFNLVFSEKNPHLLKTFDENATAEIAKLLLEAGANANEKTEHNLTLLGWTSINGSVPLSKVLIEHGADVNARFGSVLYPEDKPSNEDFSPLMFAVVNINKDIELVNLLIEHGADVNAKDSSGRSVLGYAKATTFDNTEIINILIQAGAKE